MRVSCSCAEVKQAIIKDLRIFEAYHDFNAKLEKGRKPLALFLDSLFKWQGDNEGDKFDKKASFASQIARTQGLTTSRPEEARRLSAIPYTPQQAYRKNDLSEPITPTMNTTSA